MKAWQFTGTHQPLVLNDVPEPVPGSGEVLIDVRACGLCHSDVGFLEIEDYPFPARSSAPVTLGHEVSGVISELSDDVEGWAVGDRVGIGNVGAVPGIYRDGGFAERITAPTEVLVPIPEGTNFEQAAMGNDAGMTSHGAVVTVGQVGPGDKVGIIGYGGLGQLGAQIAQIVGGEVYVAEVKDALWEQALEAGAKRVVKDIRELADEELDVVIDFAGVGVSTAAAIDAVRSGGRVVQVGMSAPHATIDVIAVVMKQLTILGSLGGTLEDTRSVYNLMASGALDPVIETIGFDEIPQGLKQLSAGTAVGRLVARIGV